MKLFFHSRSSRPSSGLHFQALPLVTALFCVLSVSSIGVHCAPTNTRVPVNELLSALSNIPERYSYFGNIFREAVKSGRLTLNGPSTILLPSDYSQAQVDFSELSPARQLKLLQYHVLRGKFTKGRLLSTVPFWRFFTQNKNTALVKLNKKGECYFAGEKASPLSLFAPLNLPDIAQTKSVVVHGVFFALTPPNM